MTRYFAGVGGNNANDGLSYANRRLTITSGLSLCNAGDELVVSPGVYREQVNTTRAGGNLYATGTVSVTNGSATVTGSGTLWAANAYADGQFRVSVIASGTDGVTNGDNTFTSAAGNFQAGMVGMTIRINTKAAYIIASVVSATSITIRNVDNSASWPTAGTGLTYNVGPETAYEIASVDSDTQITLKQAWAAPSLTGLAYQTWRDIKVIADVSGAMTDGVGGICRVTGSDNDTTAARFYCFNVTHSYHTIRGFMVDLVSVAGIEFNGVTSCIAEDCFAENQPAGVRLEGASQASHTVRRCVFYASGNGVYVLHSATLSNITHQIENCIAISSNGSGVRSDRVGGFTVRNCYFGGLQGVRTAVALAAGQTITVNNCVLNGCGNQAFVAANTGEITEDYNSLSGNAADRQNTATGTHSVSYPALLAPPRLLSGFMQPLFGMLSEWSALRAITGTGTAADDLFGIARPATAAKLSWGAIQYADFSRSSTQAQAGTYSGRLADEGEVRVQRIAVTNVSTTISMYVRWESGYTGSKPQMLIKQPGQADQTATAAGSADTWEQLSITWTPAATPGYVEVWLKSRNAAAPGTTGVYCDTLEVA